MLVAVLIRFAQRMVQLERRGQRRKRQQAQPQEGHNKDYGKPFCHSEKRPYHSDATDYNAVTTHTIPAFGLREGRCRG